MTSTPVPAEAVAPRRVTLLGSTTAQGRRAWDVIASHPEHFTVVGLAADGSRPDILAAQRSSSPAAEVVMLDPPARAGRPTGWDDPDAATRLVLAVPTDVVVDAIPGLAGLPAALAAHAVGARLVLTDRDHLVAGGSLITRAGPRDRLLLMTPTHMALAHCLRTGDRDEVSSLLLTAPAAPDPDRRGGGGAETSGRNGPDGPAGRTGTAAVNAATLAGSGLDMIAAASLFDVPYKMLGVVRHPEGLVPALVAFRDGATVMQSGGGAASAAAQALTWPRRLADPTGAASGRPSAGSMTGSMAGSMAGPLPAPAAEDLSGQASGRSSWPVGSWTLEPVDLRAFPALAAARTAGLAGGMVAAAYGAANERAVAAHLAGRLPLLGVGEVLEGILDESDDVRSEPGSVQDVFETQRWARVRADEIIRELVR